MDLYITDSSLKISWTLYWYSTSISHGVKNIPQGCGVRAYLMLFLYCEIWGVFVICYIKMPSCKSIGTHTFNVCKRLQIKIENENTLYWKNIFIYFKEKSNFVFTSIFSCFQRPGSLFFTQVFNWIAVLPINWRIVAALVEINNFGIGIEFQEAKLIKIKTLMYNSSIIHLFIRLKF